MLAEVPRAVETLAFAVLAGAAVGLWMRGPSRRVVPMASPSDGRAAPRRSLFGFLPAPRPDAATLGLRVAMACAAAVGVGFGLAPLGGGYALVGWLAMLPMVVAGTLVLGRLESARSRQRRQRLTLDLPLALELLSACLAAGLPLRQATRAVAGAVQGPVAEDLSSVLTLVDLGFSDAEAWLTLRDQQQWAAAAVDLARSVESGTMMVEVLVHHARAARLRRRSALEVRARSVGVRSVLPLMTCFLPSFMLLGVIPTVVSALSAALS